MTDREMLEYAAKAAGYALEDHFDVNGAYWPWCVELARNWNPRTDKGDALMLAAKLHINVEHMKNMGGKTYGVNCWPAGRGDCAAKVTDGLEDYAGAMCLAITQAAAEIGRAVP